MPGDDAPISVRECDEGHDFPAIAGGSRGPRGGCAPHFLLSCQKKMRRARWKRKTLMWAFGGAESPDRGDSQTLWWRLAGLLPAAEDIEQKLKTCRRKVGGWVVIGVLNRKASACWPRAFRFATRCLGNKR